MQHLRITIFFIFLFAMPFCIGLAQNNAGEWTFGIHGGVNTWLSDYNQYKVGEGGDLMMRYGLTNWFSAGVVAGYEELKANQDPISKYPFLKNSYLKLHAIPVAMVGYIHLAPGSSFNPFLFAGLGAMLYKRVDGAGVYVPNSDFVSSVLVPMGVGFEIPASQNISFVASFGLSVNDNYTDNIKAGNLDSYASAKIGLNFRLGSSDGDDNDKDGLTNGEEKTYGTDMNNPDTDGDGLSDGDEVNKYHTNPLKVDTDGDGLSDKDEVSITDPNKTDTDGDGLSDGDEVSKYKTDPLKTETDGDGLSDGEEVNKYHTDPLKMDTDGDGLSDGDEVNKYHSDALKVDTDGDGLSDFDEVTKYHTDPLKMDTDGDGLSDSDELNKYHTDPLKVDTDGGGTNDGTEIARGANPLDPSDDIIKETIVKTDSVFINRPIVLEKGKTVILKGVNFETGKATLTSDSRITLRKAYNALVANPDVEVEIAGHTDSVGNRAYNRDLSIRRAKSVKAWLVKEGISADRMTTLGKGMDEPIDVNSTAEGRANNRRIEFRVKK